MSKRRKSHEHPKEYGNAARNLNRLPAMPVLMHVYKTAEATSTGITKIIQKPSTQKYATYAVISGVVCFLVGVIAGIIVLSGDFDSLISTLK